MENRKPKKLKKIIHFALYARGHLNMTSYYTGYKASCACDRENMKLEI